MPLFTWEKRKGDLCFYIKSCSVGIQYILKSFTNSGPPEGVLISDITMYIIDIIVAHIFH